MSIHDWSRVTAGTFHDFYLAWMTQLQRAFNCGVLPSDYYGMVEQAEVEGVPRQNEGDWVGGVAVATAPPHVAVSDTITESMLLAAKKRRLVIRHTTGDRIVAILEIVSPGNKEKRGALELFVDKAVGALDEGLHLMVLDLFPPGTFDPKGIHGAIWGRMGGTYEPPAGKPLSLAGYSSGQVVTCYVEPTAVGTALIPMPLFLTPERYVNVPLEETYLRAYEGVPQRWKRVIEGK